MPLADMLANTVGILLFILAFTVLASGGAMVLKRLPRERTDSDQKSLLFLVRPDGIYAANDALMKSARESADSDVTPAPATSPAPKIQDAAFTYESSTRMIQVGNGQIMLSPKLTLTPRPHGGVRVDRVVQEPKGAVARALSAHKPSDYFVYCLVEKEAISEFQAFREHVTQTYHYSVGWSPHDTGTSIIIGNSSGGTTMAPQ